EGYSFTWAHPSAKKMSKLDRFLMTNGLVASFPHISAISLDRHLSDHRPILLRKVIVDYGATPSRFYHSWLGLLGFDQMVMSTWNSIVLDDSNMMIRFKKKLQILKKEIRAWIAIYNRNQKGHIEEIKSKLKNIDQMVDQGMVTDDILLSRMDLMKQLHDVHSSNNHDVVQKAKVRWAIKGNENSKYFHAIINRKRAHLSVKGVLVNGDWVDDPICVKQEFCNHFATRFQDPGPSRGCLNFDFPFRLNDEQNSVLESPVTREEICIAVWGCGEDKSPGTDGFTFEFYECRSTYIKVIFLGLGFLMFFPPCCSRGAESHQLSLFTNLLDTVILSNMEDIWFFLLERGCRFCVKDVRCLLDDVFLPKAE
nr:RNA-directed DNA polymerase, eukaryota [Tanacetum cinerariifolium]